VDVAEAADLASNDEPRLKLPVRNMENTRVTHG